MTTPDLRPSRVHEVINPDVSSYCWSNDGWECAGEATVSDARRYTRGKATAAFVGDEYFGDITMARVWKRYVRCWTRLDAWEYSGRERFEFHNDLDMDEAPELPPDDWEPDWESDPVWEFVHRSDPAAIPVWICAGKDSEPPQNPKPRAAA